MAVFLAVVVTAGDDDCTPPSTTDTLATLSLAGRLAGVLGRGLVLISLPGGESGCAPTS